MGGGFAVYGHGRLSFFRVALSFSAGAGNRQAQAGEAIRLWAMLAVQTRGII